MNNKQNVNTKTKPPYFMMLWKVVLIIWSVSLVAYTINETISPTTLNHLILVNDSTVGFKDLSLHFIPDEGEPWNDKGYHFGPGQLRVFHYTRAFYGGELKLTTANGECVIQHEIKPPGRYGKCLVIRYKADGTSDHYWNSLGIKPR